MGARLRKEECPLPVRPHSHRGLPPFTEPHPFPFTDGHPGDHSGAGIEVSLAIIYQIPILARSLPFQKTPPQGTGGGAPRLRLRSQPADPGATALSR